MTSGSMTTVQTPSPVQGLHLRPMEFRASKKLAKAPLSSEPQGGKRRRPVPSKVKWLHPPPPWVPRNREKPRCRSRPGRRLYARWGGGQPRGRCTYIHKQTNGQARWGIRLNKQERPRTRAFRACPLPWLAGFRAPLSRGQCTGEFCGGGFTRVGARTRALGFLAESPK